MTPVTATAARYRGRFAPSPTGPLHFGSLLAALASYCDARRVGGEWLVRIEDVDEPRSRPGAEQHILATLARYGFAWDGDVVRQSERGGLYARALQQLIASGAIFPCSCTRRALEHVPIGPLGERVYPGTCRHRAMEPPGLARRPYALRVKVDDKTIRFVDGVQGPQTQSLADDVGDFVVRRADGLVAYQLAVVVDDAEQAITTIVRGADLLASTARQIHLQQLLGFPTPEYLHVPVAINAAGEKLSKQTSAPPLPAEPLPALLLAWNFLGQAMPAAMPQSVDAFWAWAHRTWSRSRLPPVPMLPAPPAAHGQDAAGGPAAPGYN